MSVTRQLLPVFLFPIKIHTRHGSMESGLNFFILIFVLLVLEFGTLLILDNTTDTNTNKIITFIIYFFYVILFKNLSISITKNEDSFMEC